MYNIKTNEYNIIVVLLVMIFELLFYGYQLLVITY